MCDWSPDDSGAGAEFVWSFWRRAKRKKKCDECEGVITRRSWYFETVFDDEHDGEVTYAMCNACHKVVQEFERVHGSAPYVSGLETTLQECIEAEEEELEDEDADEEELGEARAAIAEWNRALSQMDARRDAAKAVARV